MHLMIKSGKLTLLLPQTFSFESVCSFVLFAQAGLRLAMWLRPALNSLSSHLFLPSLCHMPEYCLLKLQTRNMQLLCIFLGYSVLFQLVCSFQLLSHTPLCTHSTFSLCTYGHWGLFHIFFFFLLSWIERQWTWTHKHLFDTLIYFLWISTYKWDKLESTVTAVFIV